jgi:hypothetical protein
LSRILLADGARLQSIKASQLSTLTYASFQGQLRIAASYFRPGSSDRRRPTAWARFLRRALGRGQPLGAHE